MLIGNTSPAHGRYNPSLATHFLDTSDLQKPAERASLCERVVLSGGERTERHSEVETSEGSLTARKCRQAPERRHLFSFCRDFSLYNT